MTTKYAYAVAQIRSLESRMFTEERLLRLSSAPDIRSAFGVLAETDYAKHMEKIKDAFDFEALLRYEHRLLKETFLRVAPSSRIIRALWLKYDFHNLKVALKGLLAGVEGKDVAECVIDLGMYPGEAIMKAAGDMIFSLPEELKGPSERATKEYEKHRHIYLIDMSLDRSYTAYLSALAKKTSVALFKSYVEAMIDLTNLKTLMRFKRTNKKGKIGSFLLSGGAIPVSRIEGSLSLSPEDIALKLKHTNYSRAIALGFEHIQKTGSLSALDKLFDDHMISIIKSAKYMTFGIEPLFAYMVAKESEIRNLRFIFECKTAGIKPGPIKERIRVNYA